MPALATLTVGRPEPLELVEAAAAGGFTELGLGLARSGERFPLVGNAELLRELNASLSDNGIRVTACEGGVSLVPDFRVDDTEVLLESAVALGARYFLLSSRDPDFQRSVESLSAFGELAATYGVRPCFEFLPSLEVHSLPEARRLILATGRDDLGIVLDTLHLSRSGGSPADVAALEPELIGYIQLCDAKAVAPPHAGLWQEALEDRLYPGDGALWLTDFLDALPPDAHIQLEAPVAANAHLSAKEQARLAAAAMTAFLERHNARQPA
jgi:sugar phosphate isomerase/epimerase